MFQKYLPMLIKENYESWVELNRHPSSLEAYLFRLLPTTEANIWDWYQMLFFFCERWAYESQLNSKQKHTPRHPDLPRSTQTRWHKGWEGWAPQRNWLDTAGLITVRLRVNVTLCGRENILQAETPPAAAALRSLLLSFDLSLSLVTITGVLQVCPSYIVSGWVSI